MAVVPGFVMAAGFVPFAVVAVLSMIISTVYILYFRSVNSNERSSTGTAIAVLALSLTLITSALVPVDVFLVSYMKFSNGTYKPWAEDPSVRETIEDSVLYTYYAFYLLVILFAFLVLPLAFFFHLIGGGDDGLQDDIGVTEVEPFRRKMMRAVKYTCVLVAIFVALVVAGYFIPIDGGDLPPNNGTAYLSHFEGESEAEYEFQRPRRVKSENILVFLLNVLNVVGMFFFVVYAGCGFSSLPYGMIKGQRSVFTRRADVDAEISNVEAQIKRIEERNEGGSTPNFDAAQLDRLQQQLRLLRRTRRELEQTGRSFLNRALLVCRPFQFLFGVFFSIVGLLIFVSLLLTSIDKAAYSLGPKHGFVLVNGSLPNPVDMLLVYSQVVFPLDYIIYCGMILFFLLCSISGLRTIGITFCCVPVYRFRPSNTKPQALLLMCFCMIFMVLALNVVMFSVVPDYTTYGSQSYLVNSTSGEMVTKRCDDVERRIVECNMSRIAYLLLAYHSNVIFFGDAYFFLIWAFLVFVVIGTGVTLYKSRSASVAEVDEEDLLEDDEEGLDRRTNPFATS